MAYRLALGVILPQLLYYAGVRLGLAAPAIVAAVTWTGVRAINDLRRSSVSPFMLYGVGVTVCQGVAALLMQLQRRGRPRKVAAIFVRSVRKPA